ncbi:MAG: hypothetical protein B1H03_04895 [Planctomycetales bacterium 4484_113]|nr:MAG: hypothetical protein B1H03_04895 [Planctomycetales bacterium 4484_113]
MQERAKTFSTRELEGAEVIELVSGKVVGSLLEAIINPSGRVEYLGILPQAWHKGGTVLSPRDILGFDDGVLLIERASRLTSYQQAKLKKSFFSTKELKQRIVIDRTGHLHGKPVAAIFEANGLITELEVDKDLVLHTLPIASIIAVGPKYIVVDLAEEGEAEAAEPPSPKKVVEMPTEKQEAKPASRVAASRNGDDLEVALSGDSEPRTGREEQLEFILGKHSPLTLETPSGDTVVKAGQVLTFPILNRLMEEGLLQQVFIALVSGVEPPLDEEPLAKG